MMSMMLLMVKAYQTMKLRRICIDQRMKFDVFVSFRGIDTRRGFVSHLCHSLYKRRIRVFKNEEERPENEPASSQVLQSIEESRAAIVVISRNFASSVSCLDELVKIIECMDKRSQGSISSLFLVVPFFYYIDPCDVLRQADNLKEHVGGDNSLEKVDKWRDALTKFTRKFDNFFDWEQDDSYIIEKATNYISQHLSARRPMSNQESESLSTSRTESNELSESERLRTPRSESNELSLIELSTLVVQDLKAAIGKMAERYIYSEKPISIKPRLRSSINVTGSELSVISSDFNNLVGMDRHIKAVETLLLDLDSKDGVGEIGVCGVRGVGKTTLVRCVYEQISLHFQDHCYVTNDTSDYSLGRDHSTCLLEEITRAALKKTSQSETINSNVVQAKLGHRKVLLIVDGVDDIGQLRNISLIARWFGPLSRLIVVTQDKSLLLESGIKHLYEVESLKYDEALQLFSQFAFKQIHVPRGFDRLSARAVFITGHIPLALKVFGSFLCGKNIREWEYELLRLEASQENCISVVSSYIGGEDDEGEEFPSYCFALG